MFSCRAFRPAQQLSSHVRRYATESPKSGGGSNTVLISALALAAGSGGYYYYQSQGQSVSKIIEKNVPAKVQGGAAPKKVFTGGDQGFVSLPLDKVEDINHNTKKFRFKFPEADSVSGLNVASALVTKFKGPDMEKPVIRPYTPTSDEDEAGFLDLIVKKYPDGPMSEHLHSMKPGEELEMKGPIPKYPWTTNKHEQIALIAGGTGITPMHQLCRAIFKNPEDKTKVTLVFGNVTEEDILLRSEWQKLEEQYPDRFRAFYVLDKPPENWQQGKGFITKDLLKTIIPGSKENNVKVFVCGPPGMYKAIAGPKKSPSEQGELTGILKELGFNEDQVFKF